MISVRPLVRYVDQDQAVIDTHLVTAPVWPAGDQASDPVVTVLQEINGSDGFHDESVTRLSLTNGAGSVRLDMVHPDRWWPAGMGEQPLYELTVSLIVDEQIVDKRKVTMGLTSVRRSCTVADGAGPALLVNGQVYNIQTVIVVDRVDENHLLPVTGDSVVLVRDHYGPDVLYHAADRAGILLVQCVPIHPQATPEADVAAQIDRLVLHPSLAGWFVGHLGRISDDVARQIKALDPTHTVFRKIPVSDAA